KKLHIDSIEKLRQAAQKHRLRKLAGFGEKTEAKLLQALDRFQQDGRRVYLAEAKVFAEAIVNHLKTRPGFEQIEVAGSYRRRKETVADLDLLAACATPGPVMDRLAGYEAVAEVLARGP